MTSSTGKVMRVGWVVDVQRDFMEPAGRLYVRDLGDASDPGATTIVATLGDAVVAAENRILRAKIRGRLLPDPSHPLVSRGPSS